MATYYKLICYAEDGTTPLIEFSTDPNHEHPYLREPENLVGQEIDVVAGTSKMGSCNIEIVDVTETSDPDQGVVTAILPTITKGTRAQLLKSVDGGAYVNVIRGVIDAVDLHDSYSAYMLTLKDELEVARRMQAFTRCKTSSVIPRGVINGWGRIDSGHWTAPPVKPLRAVYSQFDGMASEGSSVIIPVGEFKFPTPLRSGGAFWPPIEQVVAKKQQDVFNNVHSGLGGGFRYQRLRFLWREVGATEYIEIENPLCWFGVPRRPLFLDGLYRIPDSPGSPIAVKWIQWVQWIREDEHTYPAPGQEVEVIIGYVGPASPDYPFHFEARSVS